MNGRIKDLTGMRFGLCVVLELDEIRNQRARWRCLCDCGKIFSTSGKTLCNGDTKSCGCWNRKVAADNMRKAVWRHGHTKINNGKPSRVYRIWKGMITRCYNKKDSSYPNYGGRGITVCPKWKEDFANFLNDMGEPPEGTSIDRIDNNGNYAPENCRWATLIEQGNNTRVNVFVEYGNERHTLAEWARLTGIRSETISGRLKRNWTIERALTTPSQKNKK